jgi:hypothetical protein
MKMQLIPFIWILWLYSIASGLEEECHALK